MHSLVRDNRLESDIGTRKNGLFYKNRNSTGSLCVSGDCVIKYSLLIISLLFSSVSLSTEVKLTSLNRYGAAPSMELALYPNNGNSLEEIFSVIKISRKELYVRLIGESSENTNSELFNFYNDKFPYWKGDLTKEPHLVKPLFVDALKSTRLYKTLNKLLKENGYHINNISFEKLSFSSSSISVPDVYIECVKNT